MLSGSLESIEAVADVSVILPVCFQNPLKKLAVEFIREALMLEKKIVLPITAILGAYHIATRYIKASRHDVKKILVELLQTRSPALYPHINVDVAVDSLDIASIYNIESWDGYIISLAKTLRAKTIFTLDKKMRKAAGIRVETPFPNHAVKEYHEYIKSITARSRKTNKTK